MDERRVFARGESHLPCTLEVEHSGVFAPPLMAQFENVSGGGALVLSRESLPEGGNVRVSVNMGDEGERLFTARVIRVQPLPGEGLYRVALEYREIDEKLRSRLFWFATEHLQA